MCEYNTTWVGVWYIVTTTSLLVISSMGGNFFWCGAPRHIKALTHAEPHYFNLVFYASVLMAIGCVIL